MNCKKCKAKIQDKAIVAEAARINGRKKSEAKSAAARANGKKGGRPRKPNDTDESFERSNHGKTM